YGRLGHPGNIEGTGARLHDGRRASRWCSCLRDRLLELPAPIPYCTRAFFCPASRGSCDGCPVAAPDLSPLLLLRRGLRRIGDHARSCRNRELDRFAYWPPLFERRSGACPAYPCLYRHGGGFSSGPPRRIPSP